MEEIFEAAAVGTDLVVDAVTTLMSGSASKEVASEENNYRTLVLGDIHGNHKALKQVFDKANFDYKNDILICLGDVVDGYAESYECVEELLKVDNLVLIKGNHDDWFHQHMTSGFKGEIWTSQGGEETIASYKRNGFEYPNFPASHKSFFEQSRFWYELDGMMFVHGGFNYPGHPEACDAQTLMWDRELLHRAKNGLIMKEWKKVFLGHTTSEREGSKPIICANDGGATIVQMDCGAGWKGRLCLMNVDTEEYWLSDYAARAGVAE